MKYLIREVGWVFNDSTFDNDGNYRTVKIFDSKEEAALEKKELDFEYFLYKLEFLHRYETYGDYKKDFRNYKAKVTKYLIEEFAFNPTIQLMGHHGYSASMFLKEPSSEDIQKLLEVMNIDFFSIIEMEESKLYQYEAKLNPFYYDGREEYLWDYEGVHKLRFDSKLDAFKRFINEEYHFYHFTFDKNPKLVGSLNHLSELPNVLDSLIQTTAKIDYVDQKLILSKEITAKGILQLNELLKEPILLFNKVEIIESKDQFDKDLRSLKNQNKIEKDIIFEKSYHFIEDKKYSLSKEFLINYSFELSMDQRFFNYKTIIENYIRQKTGIQLRYEYGRLYYDKSLLTFYGVIKSLHNQDGKNLVEGCFGYGMNPIVDIMKTAYGTHQNLETAFDESLKNWLNLYGEEYIEYLDHQNNKASDQ